MNLEIEVQIPQATDIETIADVVDVHTDPDGAQVLLVATPGPPGPPGTGGGGGAAWFTGVGPPGTILGASPGDNYTDVSTGNIYRLGD